MRFAGLDEAALGPKLGPFCAALTEFDRPDPARGDIDLYEAFGDAISRRGGDARRLAAGDSKALYTPQRGISVLEESVLGFLSLSGAEIPLSLEKWVEGFCPQADLEALSAVPWFAEAARRQLPLSSISWDRMLGKSEELARQMKSRRIALRPPKLRFATAASFNGAIAARGGKSGAVQSIIGPLLRRALRDPGPARRRISVDRQGGRRYYGGWLANLFPGGGLRALEEGAKRSSYTLAGCRIEFLVSADRLFLETALASMFAKYLRELAMKYFNDWWCRRVPNLRPTAGYPQDARRFVADLETAGALPDCPESLIRRS